MNLLVGLLLLSIGSYLFYWALMKNTLEKEKWIKNKNRFDLYWVSCLPSFPKIIAGYILGSISLFIGIILVITGL